jgi:hypothetical protein
MLSQTYKEPIYVFIAIYAIFGIIIFYIIFSNQGFEIQEKFNQNTKQKEFFLQNLTKRKINDINITYLDNKNQKILKNESIKELMPEEKKMLDITSISASEIKITATSTFYNPAEKIIIFETQKPTIKTSYPRTVKFGQRFDFTLEYCNNDNKDTQKTIIEENHDKIFFLEKPITKTLQVKAGECEKITYNFLAAHRGETKIYFNVITPNTNQQIEEIIRVE